MIVAVLFVLIFLLDGHVGRFLQPSLQSNELWEVQQNGKIVPRVGVSLETVLNQGILPSQIDGAYQLPDGTWAIPLKGSRAAWIREEMYERLMNGESVQTTSPTPIPVDTALFSRIRPGAWMLGPHPCTLNYIFKNKATGEYAIGTAGHCVDDIDQVVWMVSVQANPAGSVGLNQPPQVKAPDVLKCVYPSTAPWIYDPTCIFNEVSNSQIIWAPVTQDIVLEAIPIGRVLYQHDNGVGDDFSLIKIYPHLYDRIEPSINVIDGPCGQYGAHLSTAIGATPTVESMPVLHFGHGTAVGTGGTARVGLGHYPSQQDQPLHFAWRGVIAGGDSGSPVRTWEGDQVIVNNNQLLMNGDGSAIGIATHSNYVLNFGTRMEKIFQIVGPDWELVSSPNCPVPI